MMSGGSPPQAGGKGDAIFDNSLDAILIIDGETGNIVRQNRACLQILGYESGSLIGKQLSILFPPDAEQGDTELVQRVRIHGAVIDSQNFLKADGTVCPMELTATIIPWEESHAIMATFRDVSERKTAEAKINEQFHRLSALRKIDMAIAGTMDVRLILNVILDQVITELGVDACSVLLLNPKLHTLTFHSGRGFHTEALRHTQLGLGEGYAGQAAVSRRVVSIPDIREATGEFTRAPLLINEHFISYFAAPLISKGQVKGVLELFHRAFLEPNEGWVDFLEMLAGQAAIALDNAAMFDDLQRSNMELTLSYDITLEGWSRALDLRDKETEGHTQRVTDLTMRLARNLGVGEADLAHMRRGAMLHDVGKLGIPDSILLKEGPLGDEEWVIMKKHPVYAYEWLSPIPFLRPALDIPYCHHEKWDGTGYPRGLKGVSIPFAARIFALVDVWDALTSDRPYRKAWTREKTRGHIESLIGSHFDPEIASAFLKLDI